MTVGREKMTERLIICRGRLPCMPVIREGIHSRAPMRVGREDGGTLVCGHFLKRGVAERARGCRLGARGGRGSRMAKGAGGHGHCY